MTVTGDTLPRLVGAGSLTFHIICPEISRGPGQSPGAVSRTGVWQ